MAKELGDFSASQTIDFNFNSHLGNGAPTTLAGTPIVAVYKDNNTVQTTTGPTLTVDFDSVTGLNHVRIVTTDTFYAIETDYEVVLQAGTVAGTSVAGTVLAHFSIENRPDTQSVVITGPEAQGLGLVPSTRHAVLTFADAIDLGVAFLQGHGREASQEVVRRAVQEAHLDIINAHDWGSLERNGAIHLHAAQATGTVTYTHSTRTLVLSGTTWPDWVLNGTLRLDDTLCDVESYVSTSTIILDAAMNPGANLAAGTGYSLFCRWYPLPVDFVNFTGPMGRNGWAYGQRISMTEMMGYQRNFNSTGTIRYYAIGERPNAPGETALYPWPLAAANERLDFTYQRRPRELQYTGRDAADMAGTITVSAGSNAISGTSTEFESGMVGAMLLIGRDNIYTPTGRYGLHRFSEQLRIYSVSSTTALLTGSNAAVAHTGVKYVVTDPIDIEPCAQNAFMRYVEMHLALARNLDKSAQYVALAEKALRDAMAAAYPVRYDPTQGATIDWCPEDTPVASSVWS
jgi:hypothetical protein